MITGVAILAYRRIFVARVRATTSPVDWIALILLAIVIVLGMIPTMGINLLCDGYDYCMSVAVWFIGAPDAATPLIYQVHATAAWAILAIWPFTRLVHAWSFPLWYLWRPSSSTAAACPPTRPNLAPADADGAASTPATKPPRRACPHQEAR